MALYCNWLSRILSCFKIHHKHIHTPVASLHQYCCTTVSVCCLAAILLNIAEELHCVLDVLSINYYGHCVMLNLPNLARYM